MRKLISNILVLAFYVYLTPHTLSVEELSGANPVVQKLSETLYVAKHPNGLWFGMERVNDNPKRHAFWSTWRHDEENIHHGDYKRKWANQSIPINQGFLMYQSRCENLTTGLYSFGCVLSNIESTKETWVSFVCINEINTENDISADKIEEAVTVTTDPLAPMITHLGISRSFSYLLKALEALEAKKTINRVGEEKFMEWYGENYQDKFQYILHRRLSPLLHSFSALVMQHRKNPQIYMITAPTPAMSALMRKAFSDDAVYGDNVQRATITSWSNTDEDRESKQIRASINKFLDEKRDTQSKLRQLERQETTKPSEYTDLEALEKKFEAQIKELVTQEQIAQAKEIQALSLVEPCFVANAPLRRQKYPDEITQIFDPEGKTVLYEFNRTKELVIINDEVFDTSQDRRFHWFNWTGGMNMTVTNPYVLIPLDKLAGYFLK